MLFCSIILAHKSRLARVKINVMLLFMVRIMLTFLMTGVLLLLSSCASTPASRIQKNPQIFQSLSTQDQALVMSGQIAQGMQPSAVYLAWGSPSSSIDGNLNGKSSVRWLYSDLQPVYHPTPYWGNCGYWDPYYNRYNPYYYPYDITYVPINVGYVLFSKGKVTAWEKRTD